MLLVHEDKRKRVVKDKEEIKFPNTSGFHLIIVNGRAKSEKQISKSSTDDEELTIGELKDPTNGANHYYDSSIPAPYWATKETLVLTINDSDNNPTLFFHKL